MFDGLWMLHDHVWFIMKDHLFCCSCCSSCTAIFLRSNTSFKSSSSSSANCSFSELKLTREGDKNEADNGMMLLNSKTRLKVITHRVSKLSSKIFACKKINLKINCCVNHVYTLPPKLSSIIKKLQWGSIFCIFTFVASTLIGMMNTKKNRKKHTKISDSECNHH